MNRQGQWVLGSFALAFLLVACGSLPAQGLPIEPTHESGQSVTGAFEGWFPNQDGTFTFLVGYFNRNADQAVDVPIGPDNQIQPGGPDQGQPTHFLPGGRQWGVFSIVVPKDFGDKRLTWSITANGKNTTIPMSLNRLWRVDPFVDSIDDKPPYIGFSNEGPFFNGPVGQSESLKAKVGVPLPLTVWVADEGKDALLAGSSRHPVVSVRWMQFRGPGATAFDNAAPSVEKAPLVSPPVSQFGGKASATATFSAPGDYILNLQAENSTEGGPSGRQCCWSNAKVKVSVAP